MILLWSFGWIPRGEVANVLDYNIVVKSSNSSRDITFTFGLIPLRKAWTTLSSPAMS